MSVFVCLWEDFSVYLYSNDPLSDVVSPGAGYKVSHEGGQCGQLAACQQGTKSGCVGRAGKYHMTAPCWCQCGPVQCVSSHKEPVRRVETRAGLGWAGLVGLGAITQIVGAVAANY